MFDRIKRLTSTEPDRDANPLPLASTIGDARLTSASADILTLDTNVGVVIHGAKSLWTYEPSAYYHHQDDYLVWGLGFRAERELFDGNATLALNYQSRLAVIDTLRWDGVRPPNEPLFTNNMGIGWTQILSKAWVGNVGLQYARQDGFTSSTYNFVVLTDERGRPVLLTDERLPDHRVLFRPKHGLGQKERTVHSVPPVVASPPANIMRQCPSSILGGSHAHRPLDRFPCRLPVSWLLVRGRRVSNPMGRFRYDIRCAVHDGRGIGSWRRWDFSRHRRRREYFAGRLRYRRLFGNGFGHTPGNVRRSGPV